MRFVGVKTRHVCKQAALDDCHLVNVELKGRGRSFFSHGPDSISDANACALPSPTVFRYPFVWLTADRLFFERLIWCGGRMFFWLTLELDGNRAQAIRLIVCGGGPLAAGLVSLNRSWRVCFSTGPGPLRLIFLTV